MTRSKRSAYRGSSVGGKISDDDDIVIAIVNVSFTFCNAISYLDLFHMDQFFCNNFTRFEYILTRTECVYLITLSHDERKRKRKSKLKLNIA